MLHSLEKGCVVQQLDVKGVFCKVIQSSRVSCKY